MFNFKKGYKGKAIPKVAKANLKKGYDPKLKKGK